MNGLRKMAVVCACSICFAPIPSVLANPLGLVTEDVTDAGAVALNLWVGELFLEFDDPGDVSYVVGDANIKTNAPGGFYQFFSGPPYNVGGDFAPPQWAIDLFPSLKYDSFVTITLGAGEGQGTTSLLPDFDSAAFNPPPPQNMLLGSWWAFGGGQGVPDENLQVLIAQLTIQKNYFVYGSLFYYPNDGWTEYWDCFNFFPCTTCTWDLNCDNRVDTRDATILNGAWGSNPCHPADFSGDGTVGNADRIILNAHLGICPP